MKTEPAVTVKYVNGPKNNGPASIKDDKGVYYKFWTTAKGKTKAFPVSTFREGGTYTIGYRIEPSFQYGDQYFIEEVQEITGAQLQAPSAAPPSNSNGHSDNRDRNIFICGVVNQGIAAGKIDPFSTIDLLNVRKAATEAFEKCP